MMLMVAEILSRLDPAATFTGEGANRFRFRSSPGDVFWFLALLAAVVVIEVGADLKDVEWTAGVVVDDVGMTDVASRFPNTSFPPPKSTFTRPVFVMLTPPTPPSLSMVPVCPVGTFLDTMIIPGKRITSATGETVGDCATGDWGSLTGDRTRLMGLVRFFPIEHCCSCWVNVRHSPSPLLPPRAPS